MDGYERQWILNPAVFAVEVGAVYLSAALLIVEELEKREREREGESSCF